jgi:hypothetical protein
MDDQNDNSSDTPGYQSKRVSIAAKRTPPGHSGPEGDAPLLEVVSGDEVIDVHAEPVFASEPIEITPVDYVPPAEMPASEDARDAETSQAYPDALPGDAAAEPIEAARAVEAAAPAMLAAPVVETKPEPLPVAPKTTTRTTPNAVIIRPTAAEAMAAADAPRRPNFGLWALIWVVAWGGAMALTLNHRFDRRFDWNTSYFSIAARNLVREGFVKLHGGMYLNAGDFAIARGTDEGVKGAFYAGHPPLTAWALAGWMQAFGQSDFAIRALPLAVTMLNLLLLYALVRRVFGGGAALASVVICSLLPMTAYYAQIVNMEPFVMTFLLAGSIGYVAWARSGSTFGFLLLVLCVIGGCWTDWPMYLFVGFLAVAHLFKRRDEIPPAKAGDEPTKAARPWFGSLFLIVLALGVFTAFMVYLKMNDVAFDRLWARGADRMTAEATPGTAATWRGAFEGMGRRFKGFQAFSDWFAGLFTLPALFLAVVGAGLWVTWSRRLAVAGGEAGRRAAFRVLACLTLMQLAYTLAFPQGAAAHEFWHYYLVVPVAVLAAGLCAWLTVAGGANRSVLAGLIDRAAWAVVALIPIAAAGPFLYRIQVAAFGGQAERGDARLDPEFLGQLRAGTDRADVILTDWDEDDRKFGLPWYADRAILTSADLDTLSMGGIAKAREAYKGRRVLYLWGGAGPKELKDDLAKTFGVRKLGHALVYVIDDPSGTLRQAGDPTPPAPATKPASTKPAK